MWTTSSVYQPLPYVKTMYYLNVDLYRYFIGRSDQSVNESVMAGRIDQQVRVTKIMIDAHDLSLIRQSQKAAGPLYVQLSVHDDDHFLHLLGHCQYPRSLGMRTELWEYLRKKDPALYRRCRYRLTNVGTNIPGYQGRKLSVTLYRLAREDL